MSRSHSSETSKQTSTSTSSSKRTKSPPQDECTDSNKSETRKVKSSMSRKYHFNSMWSLWYCLVTLGFTAYLVYTGVRRFLIYASLPWPDDEEPYMELNAHVGLVGAAVVVIPFFIVASVVKVGNLPNDGFKLGSSLSTCSRDPPSVLQPSSGIIRNLWLHGVPTSPFLHLIAAFCLLLPQTLMGAALIKARFLPQSDVWRSDLDVFLGYERPNATWMQPLISKSSNDTPTTTTPRATEYPPMVLIQGTQTPPTPQRPQQPWRSKRSSNDFFKAPFEAFLPGGEFGSGKYSSPFTAPVKGSHKKMEPLSSFSPHQGGRKPSVAVVATPAKHRGVPVSYKDLRGFTWRPFSPELINYALALVVFSVRYPSVFWHTNKKFSFLFSIHLILTGIQTIILVSAFSVFYKFQVNGLRIPGKEASYRFVSSAVSSLLLFLLAVLTLTVSSSAVYFYGYQRFAAFLDRSRKRFHITYTSNPAVMRPHTTHLGALAVLLCLSLSMGPLLWDFSSLHTLCGGNTLLLMATVTSILYLVLWILFWIYLSVKSSWIFKLRVTVARAFVSSARSIKLINDVEMSKTDHENALTPILVVGNGRAVAIKDGAPKKAIMGVVNKIKEEKKAKGREEEIYWLRPTFNSSFDRGKLAGKNQPKVTFNDMVEEKYAAGKQMADTDEDEDEDEAGDYAILKESFPSYHPRNDSDMSSSDSDKSERSPNLEDPRYVDRTQMLAYQKETQGSSSTDSSPILVAPDYEDTDHFEDAHQQGPPSRHQIFLESQGSVTPRSTRSNDSGMPIETPSQRSDSLSSSSSNTPQENSEESGVHSGVLETTPRARGNSDEDLSQLPHDPRQPLLPTDPSSAHIGAGRHGMGRPTRTMAPLSAETTVAIRRHRHLTREIRPPADPIYGTRKVTSFGPSDEGFQSPVPSPVPPMPPLPSLEESGVVGLFPPRHTPLPGGHARVNLQHQQTENLYSHRGPQVPTHKYPQMPLPPIPQGIMAPQNSAEIHRNSHAGMYGRTNGPQQPPTQSQHIYHLGNSEGVYGYRGVPTGRSSSLRYPSTRGALPKQYTNTFPHVLPKESQYNTNV